MQMKSNQIYGDLDSDGQGVMDTDSVPHPLLFHTIRILLHGQGLM